MVHPDYQPKKRKLNPLLKDEEDSPVKAPEPVLSLEETKKADEANKRVAELLIQGLLGKNQPASKEGPAAKKVKMSKDEGKGKKQNEKGKAKGKVKEAAKEKVKPVEQVKLSKKELKVVQEKLPTANFLKMLPLNRKKKLEEEAPKKDDIWFDGVEQHEIEKDVPDFQLTDDVKVVKSFLDPEKEIALKDDDKIGKYVAMDCEMVGVGEQGRESVLARVSIVNFHGRLILDRFVRPKEKVTDFRTAVSGIRPADILGEGAKDFEEVQKECAKVFQDRIVVGHGLVNDFQALLLTHPKKLIRDTSTYPPYRKLANGLTPSMRMLAKRILGMQIQKGEHSSIDDAKVAMLLYRHSKEEWEQLIVKKQGKMKFVDKKARKNKSLGALPAKKAKLKAKVQNKLKENSLAERKKATSKS